MSLRFHEISEGSHHILNPFTEAQLLLLGDICGPDVATRQLDLCCGKAELLCQWARRYGLHGVGVDISPVFLEAARQRVAELGVEDQVTLVHADAASYPIAAGAFDIVSCLGATWIGGGLVGTLELMKPGLKDGSSLLLVGEPYWTEPPPPEAVEVFAGGDPALFAGLDSIKQRFDSVGLELVEMVLADHHGWDRYAAAQWMTVSDWLRDHPDDPDAPALRRWIDDARRDYLAFGRRYLGWGVFVLRQS